MWYFLHDVIKEHTHVSGNKQEHICGICKAQLFLPLYDPQDKETLMYISVRKIYTAHT